MSKAKVDNFLKSSRLSIQLATIDEWAMPTSGPSGSIMIGTPISLMPS
jgi:hypothetical protein